MKIIYQRHIAKVRPTQPGERAHFLVKVLNEHGSLQLRSTLDWLPEYVGYIVVNHDSDMSALRAYNAITADVLMMRPVFADFDVDDFVNEHLAEYENACDCLYYGYGFKFWYGKHKEYFGSEAEAKIIWNEAFLKMSE